MFEVSDTIVRNNDIEFGDKHKVKKVAPFFCLSPLFSAPMNILISYTSKCRLNHKYSKRLESSKNCRELESNKLDFDSHVSLDRFSHLDD